MKNYTPYHIHSDYSLLDSCTQFEDYVDYAIELGQNSIAFTEHGNIFNWVTKKMYCDKKGIKYIHGVEVYLTEKYIHSKIEDELIKEYKVRDNFHTILLAKNEDGVKEINTLVTNSTLPTNQYYKPRISFEDFFNISDNVIKISACLLSPLNKINEKIKLLVDEEEKRYYENILNKLLEHYDYYEIQYHNINDQKNYNTWLYEQSKKYNKPLIAGTDTHSLNKYKSECREVLQKGKVGALFGTKKQDLADKNNDSSSVEDTCDLSFKTYEELVNMFEIQNCLPENVYLEAIENTNIMADSVEDFVLDSSIKYPILYGEEDDKKLVELIYELLEEKIKNGIIDRNRESEYIEQIEEEIRVFRKTGMMGFILAMAELCIWSRKNNYHIGIGRGCFTKSALIYTRDNLKTIDKIKVGDYVLSDNNKWNKVVDTFIYDIEEELIEFEYQNQGDKKYKNQCTLDHKVLVFRNGQRKYVKAQDLILGDYLCSPKLNIKDLNFKEKKIDKIDLNEYNDIFRYDDCFIYEVVNNIEKKVPRYITLDKEINRLIGIICSNGNFDINSSIYKNESNVFKKWLKEFVLQNKNVFNDKLLNQSEENLLSLYQGLKDGNTSCIEYKNNCFSIISVYKTLKNIFDKENTEISIYDTDNVNLVAKNVDFQDENFWYLPITKIIKLSKSKVKVYDFEVENCHSYTINNIIVHNSVGGSLVAFVTKITELDPMVWNTIFSRFCNEDRVEIGDKICHPIW